MITGETMVLTSGQEVTVVTLTFGVSEVERLREALRQVRPKGHDHLCENGPDDPDTWIDETADAPIDHTAFTHYESGIARPATAGDLRPYVGWCCEKSRQRHLVDDALREDARTTPILPG